LEKSRFAWYEASFFVADCLAIAALLTAEPVGQKGGPTFVGPLTLFLLLALGVGLLAGLCSILGVLLGVR
jgi:hypothetical protein